MRQPTQTKEIDGLPHKRPHSRDEGPQPTNSVREGDGLLGPNQVQSGIYFLWCYNDPEGVSYHPRYRGLINNAFITENGSLRSAFTPRHCCRLYHHLQPDSSVMHRSLHLSSFCLLGIVVANAELAAGFVPVTSTPVAFRCAGLTVLPRHHVQHRNSVRG